MPGKAISRGKKVIGIGGLHERVRELVLAARRSVARGVDLIQVHTNYEIGRHIVEHEQGGKGRAEYGEELIHDLATRLTDEFGNGFSERNLAYMRSFFLLYRDRQDILQTVSAKSTSKRNLQTASAKCLQLVREASPSESRPFNLSWSHYVFLLGIKTPEERSFYEIEAADQGWTIRELKRQFDSSLYERLALSRDKAGIRKLAKKGHLVSQPQDLFKEPLVLEFLGLSETAKYSESELETAIINQIERFLLELGKGFLFEARQKRFTFDGDHFFVDLVFYNRLLRAFVLIDLKIGKLTHQDLGQMQMYVNWFDRQVRTKDENPTIGIVLCKKKNSALVEITLPKKSNIHAKEYQLYLPSKEELQKKLEEWAGEVNA